MAETLGRTASGGESRRIPDAGDPVSQAMASSFGPASPVRTAVLTVGTIALADIVSMLVLQVLQPAAFWPETLLDTAIMACLTWPAVWLLIARPLSRLLEERRLAEEKIQRRSMELEALYGVTSAAAGGLDLDGLLTRVLDVSLPVFGASAGWVLAHGGEPTGTARFVVARGVAESLVRPDDPDLRAACGACNACSIPAPGPDQPLAIAECGGPHEKVLREAGFGEHRAFLLPVGEKTRAVVNLLWNVPRRLDEAEVNLLRAIGRQVHTAVEKALLFAAEQRARQESETLRSAGLAITRSLDLETVLPAVLEYLGRLVPYDRAKVILFEGRSRLKVHAIFTRAGILDFSGAPLGSFDAEGNAAVKEVLESRQSVCIGDTLGRPDWGALAQAGVERSWLGVPLIAGGEVIGLMTVVKAEPGYFTPAHVALAEALATSASGAIAHARIFQEVLSGREQIQKVTRKLVEAQESERRRIALELHDDAGQQLTSLMLGLRVLEHESENPEAIRGQARELKLVVDMVQEGLHRLASDLRPAALDHVGLVPALGQLAAGFMKTGGPEIRLETVGFAGRRLSPDLDIALYRIVQEGLTNAVRHAGATAISVVLTWRGPVVVLVVEDNGRGFNVEAATQSGRLGLAGIRERAGMIGGKLLVESSPGKGTTLVMEIPYGN